MLKRLLAKKDPLIPSDLWQEIEKLKERNRQLRLKIGAERRESIEKISELEHQAQNLMLRLQQKQVRLDELETQDDESDNLAPIAITQGHDSATARDFPEAADLLNQLKTKRKKSAVTLADVEAILEMIER